MSSILKALEKVEESRSTRRTVGVNTPAHARVRRSAWVVPACVLGGAVTAALATYAIMGGFSRHPAPVAGAKAVARPVPVAAQPLAAAPAVQATAPAIQVKPSPAATPATAAVAPAMKGPAAKSPAPTAKVRLLPGAVVVPSAPVPGTPAQAAVAMEPHPPVAAAPATTGKTRSEIRVTGIAWQKDGESSAAIVNGLPVQQGSMVDGFKVEEIYQDKVRFSGTNGSLEVPLGAGQ